MALSTWTNLLRRHGGWALFGALLLVQWVLFRGYVLRELAWSYPASSDQSAYLLFAYSEYEDMRQVGLWPGICHGLTAPSGNGILLPVQAAVLCTLFGPGRLTCLTVHFAYFALLQLTTLGTLRWLSRRWDVAFLGLGLLLTAATAYFPVAGVTDFRMDFIVFCLFGVFLALALRSRLFTDWRWAALAGLAAGVLVLNRFLALVHVLAVLGPFLAVTVGRAVCAGRGTPARQQRLRSLAGGVLVLAVLAAVSFPVLWNNRSTILGYYAGVPSAPGAKAGWSKEAVDAWNTALGAGDRFSRLAYYPAALWRFHLGSSFVTLAAMTCLVGLFLLALRRRDMGGTDEPATIVDAPGTLLFVALAVALPLGVLTAYPTRSPVVCNVLVPGLAWFALLPLLTWLRKPPARTRLPLALLPLLGVAAMACGLEVQRGAFMPPYRPLQINCARRIASAHEAMYEQCRRTGLRAPLVCANSLADYLDTMALQAWMYERHGTMLQVAPSLAPDIAGHSEEQALVGLRAADFVFLLSPDAPKGKPFPFNTRMTEYDASLRGYCEDHLVCISSCPLIRGELALFMRPRLTVPNPKGEWGTDRPLVLRGPADWVRRFPVIRLTGPFIPELGDGKRLPSAVLVRPGRPACPLPVAGGREGNLYAYTLTVTPEQIAWEEAEVEIRVQVDGGSEGELKIPPPQSVILDRPTPESAPSRLSPAY